MQVLFSAGGWIYGISSALAWVYLLSVRLNIGKRSENEILLDMLVELKPIYWPASLLHLWETMTRLDMSNWDKGWDVLGVLVGWYLIVRASQDDDRWKRRREKLLEKVSVSGGRLVVTPT